MEKKSMGFLRGHRVPSEFHQSEKKVRMGRVNRGNLMSPMGNTMSPWVESNVPG